MELHMCLGWGWYLQVDFQLFVASIFLVYFYSKSKKGFFSIISVLSILSTIYVFVYTMATNYTIYTDINALSEND